ncbi:hypothetical protein [Hymenobacter radiodurans]|uniref:hypothetical protein n=1 Tax=Hymenobacter radiodurans TaxID=2496028 RepID=UPI001F0FCDE6|nr:hypothetical protein [Hymenobacter radiodurans]
MTLFFRFSTEVRWWLVALFAISCLRPAICQAQSSADSALVAPTSPLLQPTQPADSAHLSRRLPILAGGLALSYTGLVYGLSKSWYTGERTSFHWFDDSREWKQVDKAGHFWGLFTKVGGQWICCAGRASPTVKRCGMVASLASCSKVP